MHVSNTELVRRHRNFEGQKGENSVHRHFWTSSNRAAGNDNILSKNDGPSTFWWQVGNLLQLFEVTQIQYPKWSNKYIHLDTGGYFRHWLHKNDFWHIYIQSKPWRGWESPLTMEFIFCQSAEKYAISLSFEERYGYSSHIGQTKIHSHLQRRDRHVSRDPENIFCWYNLSSHHFEKHVYSWSWRRSSTLPTRQILSTLSSPCKILNYLKYYWLHQWRKTKKRVTKISYIFWLCHEC